VFRTVGDQVSLWEAVLPGELLKLPDELARVDGLLDDPVFFAPGSRHGQVTCVASCALRKLR
jgi:hypothetical protein